MPDSLPVISNQTGAHEDLSEVVSKHLRTAFLRPIPTWVDQTAGDILAQCEGRPLILDSGCGTGHSTVRIATENPDCLVVGIDQSAHRLKRSPVALSASGEYTGHTTHMAQQQGADTPFRPPAFPPFPDNVLFVRADVQDLWRALLQRGVRLHSHYLLYPNPWPKAHHLMRRWHGHPVWPSLLALGGRIQMRTNWEIYALEFHQALLMGDASSISMDIVLNLDALAQPMSLFEKKYAESGHTLWRVTADLQ